MLIDNKEVIPVFFATDNNYAPFLAVAIKSMLTNASKKYFYKIYVLTTNLNPMYVEQLNFILDETAPGYSSIEFKSLRAEMEKSNGTFHLRDYYSKETYCRIFIPRLFPQYDKVLYLDCDIAVVGDISQLYNTDVGDNIVGAIPEEVMTSFDVFGTYVEKFLGIDRKKYFSAGILLINTKRYRELDIETKFIKLMNAYKFRVTQDEDYLNVLCKDKVKYIELGWNKSAYKSEGFDDKNLKLVHYKINWKPWHYDNILYEDYFWDAAKKTGFYDQILKIKAAYGDDLRERDHKAYLNLAKMAEEDAAAPDGFWNDVQAGRCKVQL